MKSIKVLSLTPDVCDWLTNSRQPRILHIFDCACNLVNESRDVLSVVTPQIGSGPFNLVVEDVLFSAHINLHSPIYNSPRQLTLGNITFHIADAKSWNPRPEWEILRARKDDIFNQLKKLPSTDYREVSHSYGLPTFRFYNSLTSSLAFADLPSSLVAAKQLAGLGIGLTPAGDDFIMGALYAAWIIHPPETASALAEEIVNAATRRTTSLSAAWLRSAGNGEAGILWHEFFDTLTDADSVRIQTAMDKILAVGATSGADALAGFMGTFISYAEQETKPCHS